MRECKQWPMTILTRPSGEDGRKLVCHPKQLIARRFLRRDSIGKLQVTDPDQIKIPRSSYPLVLYAEPKLQGHRHIYSCDKYGRYHLHSRRLGVDGSFPDLIQDGRFPVAFDELEAFPPLPRETAIDGELVWPGHPDSEVPTAIKECPEQLQFKAFAVPIHNGKSNIIRGYHFGRVDLRTALPSRCIARVGTRWRISSVERMVELIEHLLFNCEQEGSEGFVLKEKHYQGWWKLKSIQEADVVMTDYVISKSDTYYGEVTSVRVGAYKNGELVDMGKVSGFDDEEKDQLTEEYQKFGKSKVKEEPRVLRVQYQELAGRGKLKHAFFDSWRPDKNQFECVIEQFGG